MAQPQQSQQPFPTRYFQIDARDTAGHTQDLIAAYRGGQFVLFQLQDGVAQVMYLLTAADEADIRHVITQRIIDVTDARPIDRPEFDGAQLLSSHPWTQPDHGLVGSMLGLQAGAVTVLQS